MTIPWAVNLARQTHPLLFPTIWIISSIAYFYLVISFSDGPSLGWGTREQIWGTALVYCLMPGYLWFCSFYQWNTTARAVADLSGLVAEPERWHQRILQLRGRNTALWMTIGILYGLSQNQLLIPNLDLSEAVWVDGSMIILNVIMFANIGLLLGRRLYVHTGLWRLGNEVSVDLRISSKVPGEGAPGSAGAFLTIWAR